MMSVRLTSATKPARAGTARMCSQNASITQSMRGAMSIQTSRSASVIDSSIRNAMRRSAMSSLLGTGIL